MLHDATIDCPFSEAEGLFGVQDSLFLRRVSVSQGRDINKNGQHFRAFDVESVRNATVMTVTY
jgi:hypothetical protein